MGPSRPFNSAACRSQKVFRVTRGYICLEAERGHLLPLYVAHLPSPFSPLSSGLCWGSPAQMEFWKGSFQNVSQIDLINLCGLHPGKSHACYPQAWQLPPKTLPWPSTGCRTQNNPTPESIWPGQGICPYTLHYSNKMPESIDFKRWKAHCSAGFDQRSVGSVALEPVARQCFMVWVGGKTIHFKAKVYGKEMGKTLISP